MQRRFYQFLVAAGLLAWGVMTAAPARAAEDLQFVTTAELKAMTDGKEKFILINALSPLEFTQTKIAGSVNIPYDNMTKGKASLPEEMNAKLIFYCKGPK